MGKHSTQKHFIALGYEFNNAQKMQHVSCDSKDNPEMTFQGERPYKTYVIWPVCFMNCMERAQPWGVILFSLELHYREGERSHKQRHAKASLSSVTRLTREKSCVKHSPHCAGTTTNLVERNQDRWKSSEGLSTSVRHLTTMQSSGLARYSSALPLYRDSLHTTSSGGSRAHMLHIKSPRPFERFPPTHGR